MNEFSFFSFGDFVIPSFEDVRGDLARGVMSCPTGHSLCVVWSSLSHERERERERLINLT